jgi:hypothetical protein
VAFVFGVSVHYIADELWEGLNDQIGRGQGFVRTLSSFNLGHDGMSDNDESTANLAADFGVAWELNETGIHPWKRYRHVFPLPFFPPLATLSRTCTWAVGLQTTPVGWVGIPHPHTVAQNLT